VKIVSSCVYQVEMHGLFLPKQPDLVFLNNFCGLEEKKTLALNSPPPQVGGGIGPLELVGPKAGYRVYFLIKALF
jgi:hypothetical protein